MVVAMAGVEVDVLENLDEEVAPGLEQLGKARLAADGEAGLSSQAGRGLDSFQDANGHQARGEWRITIEAPSPPPRPR